MPSLSDEHINRLWRESFEEYLESIYEVQRRLNEQEAERFKPTILEQLLNSPYRHSKNERIEVGMGDIKSRDAVYTDEKGRPFISPERVDLQHSEGEIPSMMDQVNKELDVLRERLDYLYDKIDPVLGPDEPEQVNAGEEPRERDAMSTLGESLRHVTLRLESINRDVTAVSRRVRL